jgi:hypothetical protein
MPHNGPDVRPRPQKHQETWRVVSGVRTSRLLGRLLDLPLKHVVEIFEAWFTNPPIFIFGCVPFLKDIGQLAFHKFDKTEFAMVMVIA